MTDTSKPPYPPNWKEISLRIRTRSGGQCECVGECGLHQPKCVVGTTPMPRRCIERNRQPATYARGKIVLTVAHLDHDPANNSDTNLRAMCQRCHLRLDIDQHRRNRARSADRKSGQTRFPTDDDDGPWEFV